MGRRTGMMAWGLCMLGLGFALAGVAVSHMRAQALGWIGLGCLLLGLLFTLRRWWRDGSSLRRGEARPTRVVALGGGTGLSVLLRGLKELDLDITAIVTVADDGGSSGRLRSALDMPPPGDIRNCLVALADTEPLLERLWQYRFQAGEGLAGHSFGNLLLAALTDLAGDFETAVREASRVLAVKGRVLPVSARALELVATLMNGETVRGESHIPGADSPIHKVAIEPADAPPLPEALAAIEEADVIVVGPGSLYTSILPNLLVQGVTEAIRRSPAIKVFVCNVMTQAGETDAFSASQHIQTVHDHVGAQLFDYVIVNTAPIPAESIEKYREQGSHPVLADVSNIHALGVSVVARHFVQKGNYVRHDARLVGEQILALKRGGVPLSRTRGIPLWRSAYGRVKRLERED